MAKKESAAGNLFIANLMKYSKDAEGSDLVTAFGVIGGKQNIGRSCPA